jgi:hypothetical protein
MKVLMMMWSETDASGGNQGDIDAWVEFDQRVRAAGAAVTNGALEPPAAAKLVRPDLSEPKPGEEVVDGTFHSGPAQIQAFYLLDCADMAEAVEWARQLPTRGTVEVRPLIEYDLG